MQPETETLAIETLRKCKPPFFYNKGAEIICGQSGIIVFDILAFGLTIRNSENWIARQDSIGELIAELLNEKIK